MKNQLILAGLILIGSTLWQSPAVATTLDDMQKNCVVQFGKTFQRYPERMLYNCFQIKNAYAYEATMAVLAYSSNGGSLSEDIFSMITHIETVGQKNCLKYLLQRYSSYNAFFLRDACSLPYRPY